MPLKFGMSENNAVSNEEGHHHRKNSPREHEIRRVFQDLDINQEGHIDLSTLVVALKELNVTSCIYTARRILESLDLNQSGRIEFDDFHAFFDRASNGEDVKRILSNEALKFVNYKQAAESGDPSFSTKYRIPVCQRPCKHRNFHSDVVQSVCWLEESHFASVSLDGNLAVWSAESVAPEKHFSPASTSIYSAASVRDTLLIVTGHSESERPLILFDYKEGRKVVEYEGLEGSAVMSLDISCENLVAGSKSGRVLLYNINSPSPFSALQISGPLVESVSMTKDLAAAGDHLGMVSIFDIRDSNRGMSLQFEGSLTRLSCVKWVTDFELLTGGDDFVVRKFDIRKIKPSGGASGCFLGHSSPITSLSTFGNGTVLSGSMDGSVRIWHSESPMGKKASNVKFTGPVLEEPKEKEVDDASVPKCALIGHSQAVKGIAVKQGPNHSLDILTCSSDTTINQYCLVL